MGEVARLWLKSQLPADRRGVCRTLFGPVDHEENSRFVRDEMSKMRQQDTDRWNFDFRTGKPCDDGRYQWSPVRGSDAGESSGDQRHEVSAPRRHSDVPTEDRKQQQTRVTDYLRKRKTVSVPKSNESSSSAIGGDKLQRRASS